MIEKLSGVVTDELSNVFIRICVDILVEVDLSDLEIVVVAATVVALGFTVPI